MAFLPGYYEENGQPPPIHRASLLSPSPPQTSDRENASSDESATVPAAESSDANASSDSPSQTSDREKTSSVGSATVHYLPAALAGSSDANALPEGYVYTGESRLRSWRCI